MLKICLPIFLLVIFVQTAGAYQTSPPYDIFYLAVGNSNYLKTKSAAENKEEKKSSSLSDFPDLGGANKSARKMASYLNSIGAVSGITLVSEENKLVTRKDVFDALDRLLDKVKKSKSQNSLVIFYFCGHGVSEGIAWNHFSIPGDFNLPPGAVNVATMDAEEQTADPEEKYKLNYVNATLMAEKAVYAGDVSDLIAKVTPSYMLMLDSCYEGKERPLVSQLFSRQLEQNLADTAKILRTLNEFHGPEIAIFAAKPGTLAQMADDPFDPDAAYGFGPIARRSFLIFEQAIKSKNSLSISKFLRQISDPAFDKPTTGVITHSTPGQPNKNLIKKITPLLPPKELTYGSGLPSAILAARQKKPEPPPLPEEIQGSPESYLSFKSPPGEFIGQGKTLSLSAKDHKISVAKTGREEITFSIKNDDTSWEASFIAPQGKVLALGSYSAQRAYFQDANKAGFNLSGDGHGCNELQARFNITEIEWDARENLIKFSADFSQTCSDSTLALTGNISFISVTK